MRLRLVLALIVSAALLLVSFAAADQLPPNELGRVMILEYHTINYPEARWTARMACAAWRVSVPAPTSL